MQQILIQLLLKQRKKLIAGFKGIYLLKEEFYSLISDRLSLLSYAAQSLYVDKPTCKLIDRSLTDFYLFFLEKQKPLYEEICYSKSLQQNWLKLY